LIPFRIPTEQKKTTWVVPKY